MGGTICCTNNNSEWTDIGPYEDRIVTINTLRKSH